MFVILLNMTALVSHKKLFASILLLFLLIAIGSHFLFRKTNTFQSMDIAVATVRIVPYQQSVVVGEEVEFSIEVDTGGEAVNTVTTNFSYPVETLELTELSLQDSFAKIWFEKETIVPGEVYLTGSLPTPGFYGKGIFAKLTFRAKANGEAQINFNQSSAVFRNLDSVNILGNTENGVVQVR